MPDDSEPPCGTGKDMVDGETTSVHDVRTARIIISGGFPALHDKCGAVLGSLQLYREDFAHQYG